MNAWKGLARSYRSKLKYSLNTNICKILKDVFMEKKIELSVNTVSFLFVEYYFKAFFETTMLKNNIYKTFFSVIRLKNKMKVGEYYGQ